LGFNYIKTKDLKVRPWMAGFDLGDHGSIAKVHPMNGRFLIFAFTDERANQ